MASPAVSTPSSAGSPAPATLAPAPQTLALKVINASSTPSIVTQKEWVIPPRPKPGRKPATDTPPTKRKAQNRAAQRAFRERRAARVGELEEQLEEEKTEYERREQEMLGRVARLEEQVRRVGGEVEGWRTRCYTVEGLLEREKAEKESVYEELRILRFGSTSMGTEAVPLPTRRNHHYQPRQQQQFQPQVAAKLGEQYTSPIADIEGDLSSGCGNCTATSSCACMEQAIASVTAGCGKCSPDSRCECSEAVFGNPDSAISESVTEVDLKRPHSPASNDRPEEPKRQRQEESTTPLEIDFTSQFSRTSVAKEQPPSQDIGAEQQITTRIPQIEPCGFCKDGSYCACADMAASSMPQTQIQQTQSSLLNNENRPPPLLHEVTPPPSDSDVSAKRRGKLEVWEPTSMHRAVAVPTSKAKANPCANGPGTCAQCLSDPRSGMFCRSLAKLKEQGGAASNTSTAAAGGCCGGNSKGGGGCCMDKPSTANQNSSTTSNQTQNMGTGNNTSTNAITNPVYKYHGNGTSHPNAASMANPPPTLSCAQAYQTLSTHSAFDRATESSELNTWLGRLNATPTVPGSTGNGGVPTGSSGAQVQHRTHGGSTPGPLEVEAASVMEVLRFFDRRFGRDNE